MTQVRAVEGIRIAEHGPRFLERHPCLMRLTAAFRPSDDLTKEIKRYVETVIKALKKAGIIPAA